MSAPDLTKIFGQFTGQTLKNPDRLSCDVDTVLESIKDTAARHHLAVRVLYPGQCFTTDFKTGRVNVQIQNDDSGALKISGFRIG